ncbi:MAG: acetyl-CoA carboxylase biotin carboxyl carrier protein [Candidatus Edwardsbacteria bacterium]
MRLSKIHKIIKLVEESKISELEISEWGTKLKISKTGSTAVSVGPPSVIATESPVSPVVSMLPPVSSLQKGVVMEEKSKLEQNFVVVSAPMVGTFYRAPAPEAPPYVEENTMVKVGQVLCIIEAMKIMNEIESEVNGRIAKILVKNAQPVEYGQELFLIEPS